MGGEVELQEQRDDTDRDEDGGGDARVGGEPRKGEREECGDARAAREERAERSRRLRRARGERPPAEARRRVDLRLRGGEGRRAVGAEQRGEDEPVPLESLRLRPDVDGGRGVRRDEDPQT